MKENVVRNEIARISQRYTPTTLPQNVEAFRNVLRCNGFPEAWIALNTNSRQSATSARGGRRGDGEQYFHLRLPFLSDRVQNRVRRILRKSNLPVRIVNAPRSLRSALTKPNNSKCTLVNCPVSDPRICQTKNCVYSLTCKNCSSVYIGSTTRPLHTRIREHYSKPDSSVYSHRERCKGSFDTKVVTKERDVTSLRIAEALTIKSIEPSINSRQERVQLEGLLF